MAIHIPDSEWAKYKQIIDEFHEDAFQQPIKWFKWTGGVNEHGEEDDLPHTYTEIDLQGGLMDYNIFRTWPLTRNTPSGEEDIQSMVLILNREYLNSLGYIDGNGNFDFKGDKDYFVIRAIEYTVEGWTEAAQAKGTPLLFWGILKRREVNTGADVKP